MTISIDMVQMHDGVSIKKTITPHTNCLVTWQWWQMQTVHPCNPVAVAGGGEEWGGGGGGVATLMHNDGLNDNLVYRCLYLCLLHC